jgi:hypothetical protein
MMAPAELNPSSAPDTDMRRAAWLVGLAVYGAALAGVAGLLMALVTVVTGNWGPASGGLVAAAFAFGTLANALLRR